MSDGIGLALVCYASQHHPVPNIRAAARAEIARQATGRPTRRLRRSIAARLRDETGTPIEPFSLEPEDADLAVDLAVIALGQRPEPGPLRVVGRDKLFASGGLLLRGRREPGAARPAIELDPVLLRRFAPEESLENPVGAWCFAPSLAPTIDDVAIGDHPPRATLEVDEDGVCLRAGPFTTTRGSVSLQGLDAVVDGTKVEQIACRYVLSSISGHRELAIRPSSPEAIIKISALAMRRGWVKVRLSLGSAGRDSALLIRLEPPTTTGSVLLRTVTQFGPPASERLARWLAAPGAATPIPPPALAGAIVDWLGLAPEWVSASHLEALA